MIYKLHRMYVRRQQGAQREGRSWRRGEERSRTQSDGRVSAQRLDKIASSHHLPRIVQIKYGIITDKGNAFFILKPAEKFKTIMFKFYDDKIMIFSERCAQVVSSPNPSTDPPERFLPGSGLRSNTDPRADQKPGREL